MTNQGSAVCQNRLAMVINEPVAPVVRTSYSPSPKAREMLRVKCAKLKKVPSTLAIPGGYLDNHMPDRYGTNTNVMRILHAGERSAVSVSPSGAFSIKALPKMSLFGIFHDLCSYSETMGHECMKQISFADKCTVCIINMDWKHCNIVGNISRRGNQNDQNPVV